MGRKITVQQREALVRVYNYLMGQAKTQAEQDLTALLLVRMKNAISEKCSS